MVKATWGTKRICNKCNTVFYDLNKTPVICPKCETIFDVEAAVKLKRNRNIADAKTKAQESILETAPDIDIDDATLDDVNNLENDDDDVAVNVTLDDNKEDDI